MAFWLFTIKGTDLREGVTTWCVFMAATFPPEKYVYDLPQAVPH